MKILVSPISVGCARATGPWRWHKAASTPERATMVVIFLAVFVAVTTWWGMTSARHFIRSREDQQLQEWERQKSVLPKDPFFQNLTSQELQQQLPVWILSLPRAVERRSRVIQHMEEANVKDYQFMDALDGMNVSAVSFYEVEKYFKGNTLSKWAAGDPYYRKKVAADLSHFRLLQKVAQRTAPAIILEDDGGPPPSQDWYADLLSALRDLPNDWDILYLNACFVTLGEKVTERLAVLRNGCCLIGYIPTPAFARAALAEQEQNKEYPIDVMYREMFYAHRVNAYICQAPLVHFNTNSNSIIGPEDQGSGHMMG